MTAHNRKYTDAERELFARYVAARAELVRVQKVMAS